jgi:hypothetical protein
MFEHPPYEGHGSTPVPYGGPIEEERRGRVRSCLLVLVVAVLIFGCWAAIAAYLFVRDADERAEDERTEAWASFDPEIGSRDDQSPDSRQQAYAEEFAAEVLPDCDLEEVRIVPGFYDDAEDFNYADHYLLRLSMAGDSDTELAYEFWAEPEYWEEEGVEWSPDAVGEEEVLARFEDGTPYEYDPRAFEPLVGGATDDAYPELLATSAADWPGGVITWASDYGMEGGSWWVYPTTWEQYVDALPYQGVEAEYVREDETWVIESWDWYQN